VLLQVCAHASVAAALGLQDAAQQASCLPMVAHIQIAWV
jgi:hypothetical protein